MIMKTFVLALVAVFALASAQQNGYRRQNQQAPVSYRPAPQPAARPAARPAAQAYQPQPRPQPRPQARPQARPQGRQGYQSSEENYGPAQYNFEWAVQDEYSGNDFGQQEQRDGDQTSGSYYVQLPDGRLQRVTYTVDGYNGYQADVSYEGEAQYPQAPQGGYQGQRQAPQQQGYRQTPQQQYQNRF